MVEGVDMLRHSAAALVITFVAVTSGSHASATPLTVAGYDAQWCGQSAYPTIQAGDVAQMSTCFANTGTVSWTNGTATEVALAVCVDTPAPQYFACNVLSPYADWAQNWVSQRIYASAALQVVSVGGTSFFTFNVKAPAGTPSGDYYFRGELVLRANGALIHPVGFYMRVHVI